MFRVFILLALLTPMVVIAQFSIGLPECNVLYSGYENIVTLGINGCEKSSLSCSGGTIRKDTINGLPCYIVIPSPTSTQIKLTASGKSKGKMLTYGSVNYLVKPLPEPSLRSNIISKSKGDTLLLELKNTYINHDFIITHANLMGQDLNGIVITPDMLDEFEVGNYLGINLTYMEKKTSKQYSMVATLKVVE